MSFLQLDTWLQSHYVEAPNRIIAACGSLAGLSLLDVGCGEMLTDIGLVANGARVTGLDLVQPFDGQLSGPYQRLVGGGFAPPADYAQRLSYVGYEGTVFPFADSTFDVVISYGAFEHISDPTAVLLEMKRVCRPAGVLYVFVYPWWPCFYGSHLTDYIPEPFFHLTHDYDWIRSRLDAYISKNPDGAFIANHVYSQFLTLNRYSARMFAEDVRRCGLQVSMCNLIAYPQNLDALPGHVSAIDAMVCGTEMVLRPL